MAIITALSFLSLSPNSKTQALKPTKPTSPFLTLPPQTLNATLPSSTAGISIAAIASATALSLQEFVIPPDALAVSGEFGILEGRTVALIHPLVMGGLFFYTVWTGYLGWQWRRVRTIQEEINELKKQVKSPVPAAVVAGGVDTGSREPAPPAQTESSSVERKILLLTEERKELLKGGFRDRHFNAGSILLGFGVFESVGGAVNTWFRTGKLFPGPHLFAGAGITILWALAAALVPQMQKGNETARNLHIALNALNVLLFIWQIPTENMVKMQAFTNNCFFNQLELPKGCVYWCEENSETNGEVRESGRSALSAKRRGGGSTFLQTGKRCLEGGLQLEGVRAREERDTLAA